MDILPFPADDCAPDDPEILKTCRKCGKAKPRSEYFRAKKGAGGLGARCKPCIYEENKAYRDSHPGQYAAYAKNARDRDREQYNEKRRAYRKKNRDKDWGYERKYRAKYPEKYRAKMKRHYKRHKESILDYWRRYYAANPERAKQRQAAWVRANPERYRAITARARHRRRSRDAAVVNDLTAEQWREIIESQGNKCCYCNTAFGLFIQPTRDHFIPVSKGGGLTKSNTVAACRRCNSSKGDKIVPRPRSRRRPARRFA